MQTNVKLINKEAVADGTMAFYFSTPQGFELRAGQFTDFTLIDPPETDHEGNTRGFSLVQAPFEPSLVAATRMRDTGHRIADQRPERRAWSSDCQDDKKACARSR